VGAHRGAYRRADREELKAVHGEAVRCESLNKARDQLVQLMDEAGWQQIGVMDRPLVAELAEALPSERFARLDESWGPAEMARLPAGLLEAETLLADTGSCVVAAHTAQERMLCYLPPVCIVAARRARLAEHLPAAFEQMAAWCAEPPDRAAPPISRRFSSWASMGRSVWWYCWWIDTIRLRAKKSAVGPSGRDCLLKHDKGHVKGCFERRIAPAGNSHAECALKPVAGRQ